MIIWGVIFSTFNRTLHEISTQNDLEGGGGGGLLPYMADKGICRWTGYGFWPLYPKQGI